MPATTCVATVTDDVYLPGTLVLLASFLRHNPWFAGEIIIIHDDLAAGARRQLERFPNLRLHQVGAAFKARLAGVAQAHPHLAHKLPIFFSLEAFNLPQYERVLKLDSDLLCTGSAAELMQLDGALLCCPDQPYFRERVRNRRTYVPQPQSTGATAEDLLPTCFNAGVMAISPAKLGSSVYDDLMNRVQPDTWATIQTGHTDSIVLNEHFRNGWTQLHEKYNYLIPKETARYTRARAPLQDAVFVHFLGRPKPWQRSARSAATLLNDDRQRAIQLWDEAWENVLAVATAMS